MPRGSWPGVHGDSLNTSTVGLKDGGITNCETALSGEIILVTPPCCMFVLEGEDLICRREGFWSFIPPFATWVDKAVQAPTGQR